MILLSMYNIQGQTSKYGEIDIESKYSADMIYYNDYNSCSVRLIAHYFNLDYGTAFDLLAEEGRERGKGADLLQVIKAFNKLGEGEIINDVQRIKGKPITLKKFLSTRANENTNYLIVSKNHINYIVVGKNGFSTMYGNDKDRSKKIYFYSEIKNFVK